MNKNLSTHITSLLSGVTAIVAVVHPGFKIPTVTQSLVVTLCAALAGGLQFLHIASQRTIASNVAAVEAYAKHLASLNATPGTTTPNAYWPRVVASRFLSGSGWRRTS